MKIGVTVPIFLTNHRSKKLLDLATRSIASKEHDIVWLPIKNFVNADFEPLQYSFTASIAEIRHLQVQGPQCVAKAWNLGIEEGIKAGVDYVLVINGDIVLKQDTIDRLVTFASDHEKAVLWSATTCNDLDNLENWTGKDTFTYHPHYSCFLVKSDFFNQIGRFDENFSPAYFEDNDMHARIILSGKKSYSYGGALFYHFGNQTFLYEKQARSQCLQKYSKLERYFVEKWGHSVVNDNNQIKSLYYKSPYNEKDKPLSYWREPQLEKSGRSKEIIGFINEVRYQIGVALHTRYTENSYQGLL